LYYVRVQEFYFEQSLFLPNSMAFMRRVKTVTGRPLVSAGLREHIFTCYDGASALFMAQGELVFAVLWQRE